MKCTISSAGIENNPVFEIFFVIFLKKKKELKFKSKTINNKSKQRYRIIILNQKLMRMHSTIIRKFMLAIVKAKYFHLFHAEYHSIKKSKNIQFNQPRSQDIFP